MKKTLIILALLATAVGQTQAATYTVDPDHTHVTFEIPHFGTSTNRGRFVEKDGVVEFDKAAKTGKVSINLPIADLSTGALHFDKHLQSADFFDVEKFPIASFTGDKFTFNGDKVSEVSGMLTLKGQAHPVTLKATNFNCYQNPNFKAEVCGGDFETVIDRTQWGIDFGLAYGFSKNVKLVIQVEAVKQP